MLDKNSAMCTGGLDGGSPEMEKELLLKSKPQWAPNISAEGSASKAMPIQELGNDM